MEFTSTNMNKFVNNYQLKVKENLNCWPLKDQKTTTTIGFKRIFVKTEFMKCPLALFAKPTKKENKGRGRWNAIKYFIEMKIAIGNDHAGTDYKMP